MSEQALDATHEMELLEGGMLTVDEAVAESRIKRTRLYDAMATGRLAFVQYGRRRLIPKKALQRLLAEGLVNVPRVEI